MSAGARLNNFTRISRMSGFVRRRAAAWLGLTPKEHSTGGKQRMGCRHDAEDLHPCPLDAPAARRGASRCRLVRAVSRAHGVHIDTVHVPRA